MCVEVCVHVCGVGGVSVCVCVCVGGVIYKKKIKKIETKTRPRCVCPAEH